MTSEVCNEVLNNTLNWNNKKTNQFESCKGQYYYYWSLHNLAVTKLACSITRLTQKATSIMPRVIVLNVSKDIV